MTHRSLSGDDTKKIGFIQKEVKRNVLFYLTLLEFDHWDHREKDKETISPINIYKLYQVIIIEREKGRKTNRQLKSIKNWAAIGHL